MRIKWLSKELIDVILRSYMVWLFPIFFLYMRNIKEVEFKEILLPCAIYFVCSLCVLLMGKMLFHGWKQACVFSILLGLSLSHFNMIVKVVRMIIPSMNYWCMLVAVAVFSYIMVKWITKDSERTQIIVSAVTLSLCALILFNVAVAMPTILRKITVHKNSNTYTENERVDRRNIYYLLCDEYASFEQLKADFNYDNEELRTALLDMKFNISETSENESTSTDVVLANIMSLEYCATDNTTSPELEEMTKNGLVHEILGNNGYQIRGVGKTEWLGVGNVNDERDREGAVTEKGENFTQIALKRGFLRDLFPQDYVYESEIIINSFDELNNIEIAPNSGVFTFFYVCAPHHPYYLKSDGTLNDTAKYFNYDGTNGESYVGEIEYINSRLVPAIKRIIAKDKDSIIILCSDHGNRFGNCTYGMPTKILNVMYYGGEIVDEFEGLSGVNTLRYLFNRELNMDFEYLELPNKK